MSFHLRNPGHILLLLVVISFTACQKQKSITGKEFIERDVLVEVLADIHLADGVTNDRKFHRRYDVDSIDILSPILEKYQVSRQMFDTTMFVYTRNPELLDLVYNDVLIKLNVMLDENNKKEPASKPES
ncbi:MAG: DUF4296 domain-containing protein [Bacteroidales bacterium]|nr:DUF4296 domain-containing protein [Bacteroidales bacterium]